MKLLLVVGILLQILEIFGKNRNQLAFKMKTLNCSSSGKTIATENLTCFIEKYPNNVESNFIVEFDVIKPMFESLVHVEIHHKSNSKNGYRILLNHTSNGCAFVNGTKQGMVQKWIYEQVDNYIPREYIHPCPYLGYMKFNNTPKVPSQTGALFLLKGLYYVSFDLFNDDDDKIISLSIDGKLF